MSEVILHTELTAQKGRKIKCGQIAKAAYIILFSFSFFSHFWLLIANTGANMPGVLWIPRIATVPLAIILGKLWQDKGFRILAVYTLLFSLRAFLPNPSNLFSNEISESVFSALWLFAGCYGLGRIIDKKQLKRLLLVYSVIWTAGMAFLCCLGINAAWTGKIYHFIGDGYVNLNGYRLNLFGVATTSAAVMCITILTGSIVVFSTKKRIIRSYYFLIFLPIIFAFALTDTRTMFICISIGIGTILFSELYCSFLVKNNRLTRTNHTWKPYFLNVLVILGVFILVMLIQKLIIHTFNRMKTEGLLIPRALADGTSKIMISTRGFSGKNVLDGRAELWESIFKYLGQHKAILLIGESKLLPLNRFDDYYSHCHNTYIQVLLESGIPGLVLVISFIVYILKKSIYIIIDKNLQCWLRLLPAILIAFLAGELADCFLWLRSTGSPVSTVFFITAGIISTLNYTDSKTEE